MWNNQMKTHRTYRHYCPDLFSSSSLHLLSSSMVKSSLIVIWLLSDSDWVVSGWRRFGLNFWGDACMVVNPLTITSIVIIDWILFFLCWFVSQLAIATGCWLLWNNSNFSWFCLSKPTNQIDWCLSRNCVVSINRCHQTMDLCMSLRVGLALGLRNSEPFYWYEIRLNKTIFSFSHYCTRIESLDRIVRRKWHREVNMVYSKGWTNGQAES